MLDVSKVSELSAYRHICCPIFLFLRGIARVPWVLNFINILIKNSDVDNCGSCSSRDSEVPPLLSLFENSSWGFSRGRRGQPLGLRVLKDSSVSLANYRSGRVQEAG